MKSMTGYGESRGTVDECHVDVVVKSVNHKHFVFNAHLPDGLRPFQQEFESVLKKKVERGRIDLDLQIDLPSMETEKLVDEERAKDYYDTLQHLSDVFNLNAEIRLRDLIDGPGVIPEEVPEDREWIRRHLDDLKEVVREAADELNEDREREGASMKEGLERDIDGFESSFQSVREFAPDVIESYREKLESVLEDTTEDGLTEEDLEMIDKKIRMFIEKVDITEELDRLASHVDQFRETIQDSGPVGRKLDFIAQEMLRETNTIAAKCKHSEMSSEVVKLKTHLEGIREQTRNIE